MGIKRFRPGRDWHTHQTSSIKAREIWRHREDASLCLNTDCRMEVGGGGWGAAGRSEGSGIPDTELQSVWITSHTSFRPITTLTEKEAEGGSRDRESREGTLREPRGWREGEKNETVWVRIERQD